ncbi:acyl-CoA dehydrogenase family protein [Nonomuraea sp. NPDC050404]|uniref:acyl-CoA dehydrogenase family protein n=1 Tax=Nonomuraea sp. NPDC050404 TaxID=3155783 RepID=UPI0033F6B1BB
MELTQAQRQARDAFMAFVRERIVPHAEEWDQAERLPRELAGDLAAQGWLGAAISAEHGGTPLDAVTFGLLNEAIGYGCSSARSLLTVHSMVSAAVNRWGSRELKAGWLPRLASGEVVGAFALTEPHAGSDASMISSTATRKGQVYVLNGVKRWITYGRAADVFLVFARCEEGPTAFLVERDSPGLEVTPIHGVLGTRASMTAQLDFRDCAVPAANVVGRPGFGLSAVCSGALETGRYTVAWGCVGILQACLDDSLAYAAGREQFGRRIADHQLVRRMLADLATESVAARLLCLRAGLLRQEGDPESVAATWMAKYYASRAAFRAASDTVQIHGANGCAAESRAQRMLRDAKIMEIIEGSTEIQQSMIAEAAYRSR